MNCTWKSEDFHLKIIFCQVKINFLLFQVVDPWAHQISLFFFLSLPRLLLNFSSRATFEVFCVILRVITAHQRSHKIRFEAKYSFNDFACWSGYPRKLEQYPQHNKDVFTMLILCGCNGAELFQFSSLSISIREPIYIERVVGGGVE